VNAKLATPHKAILTTTVRITNKNLIDEIIGYATTKPRKYINPMTRYYEIEN